MCPSVRLHDNFRKNNPIVMKFSTLHYPMNISVEFEDEFDSSTIYWFSLGTFLLSPLVLMEMLTSFQFSKTKISHIVKTNRRLFYVVRERISLAYKMIRNYRDKSTALKDFSLSHLSNTMKNSSFLTQCLNDMWLFPMKPA